MSFYKNINRFSCFLIVFVYLAISQFVRGQEETPNLSTKSTYHNQLFFNRYLINPTFSLVRENKSYLNILHRNQYATFEDNSQNYFLGFSNRINENTALGIGVYSQWEGVVQEFGFNANYARAVKLGAKSKLTFGANFTYFNEGLDKNRITTLQEDPELQKAGKESKIAIQPGVTLSVGNFDFGLYAEDLFRFNQTTNEFITNLNTKSIKASLQYTHTLGSSRGLFENARIMPLVQLGKNTDDSFAYLGSILFDMPNYGWFQTTLDDEYGMSMGLGFNLNKKMSLGYLMEKDIKQEDAKLGWNHELSLAYTFKNDDDQLVSSSEESTDSKIDRIVRNYEEQILSLKAENKSKNTKRKNVLKNSVEVDESALAYENRLILDGLILRQDSLEKARINEFEKRFETIVRTLRSDLRQTIKTNFEDIEIHNEKILIADAASQKQIIPKTKDNKEPPKTYKKYPIRVLNQEDIIGVKSGYYVIVNVYKNVHYMKSFMKNLTDQGLKAKKFYNKENGLYYVYLADYNYKQDAETAFVSNLNGKYRDEKWIMQVDNTTATAANIYEDQ